MEPAIAASLGARRALYHGGACRNLCAPNWLAKLVTAFVASPAACGAAAQHSPTAENMQPSLSLCIHLHESLASACSLTALSLSSNYTVFLGTCEKLFHASQADRFV